MGGQPRGREPIAGKPRALRAHGWVMRGKEGVVSAAWHPAGLLILYREALHRRGQSDGMYTSVTLADLVYLANMALWLNILIEAFCSCITNTTSGPEKNIILKNTGMHCTCLKVPQRTFKVHFP